MLLQTTNNSGLIRAYFTPSDWQLPLPSIYQIVAHPNDYIDLMYHLGLNHRGLNWKIYNHQLNKDTYPVFLCSLAYCISKTNPCNAYSWQISSNAQKLVTYLEKNDITIKQTENILLEIALDFPNWKPALISRAITINSIIKNLNILYT